MFDEDLHANLLACLALAPRHCEACGDFHLLAALRRTTASRIGLDFDRDVFVALGAEALARHAAAGRAPSVLIAGAADTAILKLVMDAALVAGGEAMARGLAITVVDLCETPLAICRDYAARHGLSIETAVADLGAWVPGRRFGLVAMHGVLPFFPEGRRLDMLRRIAGWAEPDGFVLSACQIAESSPRAEAEAQTAGRIATLDAHIASAGAPAGVDIEALRARIRRGVQLRRSHPRLFADEAAAAAFHEAAGLALVAQRSVDLGAATGPRRYDRRLVLLARPAAG